MNQVSNKWYRKLKHEGTDYEPSTKIINTLVGKRHEELKALTTTTDCGISGMVSRVTMDSGIKLQSSIK